MDILGLVCVVECVRCYSVGREELMGEVGEVISYLLYTSIISVYQHISIYSSAYLSSIVHISVIILSILYISETIQHTMIIYDII